MLDYSYCSFKVIVQSNTLHFFCMFLYNLEYKNIQIVFVGYSFMRY